MSFTITIPDELLSALESRACDAGLDREQYMALIVSRELQSPPNIDDVLRELREDVKARGLTDEELTELFESARDEVYATKKR